MEDSGRSPRKQPSALSANGIEDRKSKIGNCFPREHRLKRRRLIRALFDRSRSDTETLAVGDVRLIYRMATPEEVGTDTPLQVGFAPGRRVRSAVERNRTRRLLREVYRRHQHGLHAALAGHTEILTLMILFRGDPPPDYEPLTRDLVAALQELARRLQKNAPRS